MPRDGRPWALSGLLRQLHGFVAPDRRQGAVESQRNRVADEVYRAVRRGELQAAGVLALEADRQRIVAQARRRAAFRHVVRRQRTRQARLDGMRPGVTAAVEAWPERR